MDKMLDFVFELETLICIMAVVPMVSTVFIGVPSGSRGEQPSRWRELILNLHQYLKSWSIQGGVVIKPQRRGFQRDSNLPRRIAAWRLFPLSFLLLPFFALFFFVRRAGCRDPSGHHGLFGIRILFFLGKHFGEAWGKLLLQTEKKSGWLEVVLHRWHDDHRI